MQEASKIHKEITIEIVNLFKDLKFLPEHCFEYSPKSRKS